MAAPASLDPFCAELTALPQWEQKGRYGMSDFMSPDKTGKPRPHEWWARRWRRYTDRLWRHFEAKNLDADVEDWAKKRDWVSVTSDTWTRWEKNFGRGTVKVGRGRHESIIFSFGANSELSFSSTRILVAEDRIMSETEAMAKVQVWWNSGRKMF